MAENTKHQEDIIKKEHFYRGQNVEELQKLNIREVAKYLPSRSRRSVLRNFDQIENFIKRCEIKLAKKKKIKTHARDLIIVPRMVGFTIGVYNGKAFQEFTVTSEMIGHTLGEFSLTRAKAVHTSMGVGATKSSKAKKK